MKITGFSKLISFLILLALLASCGKGGNKLKGTITNADGRTVYLEQFKGNTSIKIDSAKLDAEGKFELTYEKNQVDFYRLGLDSVNYCILILDSTDNAEITADAKNIFTSYNVTGSENSKIAREYYLNNYNYSLTRQQLRQKLMMIPVSDTVKLYAALAEIENVNADYINGVKSFIDKHASQAGVIVAMQDLNPMTDLDYLKKIEATAARTMNNTEMHRSIKAQISRFEYEKQLYEMQVKEQERLAGLLKPGTPAPEINLPDPDGRNIALSSLKGKYVLIDFWASWCGPCRKENPNVVALYNKYKSKGFEIYSVSLDKDRDKWVNAINADGLVWKSHVSDLLQWQSSVISLYGFNAIPFTVLVDKDGNVIGTNLRGPDLESKLETLFGS